MLDPTEILRFKNLQAARVEAIGKTVFYGFQIVYGMFWCVPSTPCVVCIEFQSPAC